MFEFLRDLLSGVLTFYAWAIGAGVLALLVIALAQGAVDLVRDLTGHGARPAEPGGHRHSS